LGARVTYFSNDETLIRLCREILSETFGSEWTLTAGTPGRAPLGDDLYLWDFTPGSTVLPQDLEPLQLRRHWFVLQRRHLSTLQEVLGTSDLNVLLKPVARATLRAFLSGAKQQMAEPQEESAGRIDTLRVERDLMLQFLIQANLKLQEYDQERNNFLARSVHDFRAPLTAISGYCGLLLEEELGPMTEEQREVLGRMQNSATRLSRISDAMFQLSIPQGAAQALTLEKTDIRNCVEQALHEVALRIEDKRISMTVDIEPPPEGLLLAKSQMEQALVNLLDNACKFTPRDGTIGIKGYSFFWERRGGQTASLGRPSDRRVKPCEVFNSFRVDISDSGPGIPASHIHKIFEEYTSYAGGQDRSGAGLGLAICRMILHQHRGRIWADSKPEGTVFSFILPVQHIERRSAGTEIAMAPVGIGPVKD
jgi:signal transduction histidine kinase